MAESIKAKAYPRKHFFVDMFTRDISLIDCILDLVDNSVDGLIRGQHIDLGNDLLTSGPSVVKPRCDLPTIEINYSDREFSIRDNCGGIGLEEAKNEVFNFGHGEEHHLKNVHRQLGVYGVGLKRAIFKIGRHFEMESSTRKDGFRATVDLAKWVKEDKSIEDWTFPLAALPAASKGSQAGTTVTVHGLHDEVKGAMADPRFASRLNTSIAQTYALFLGRYMRILIGDKVVAPIPVPFGASDEVTPASTAFTEDGVKVYLFASILPRGAGSHWNQEQAGWYVACNGRLVVAADKTVLTGWGTGALPAFHSKYRGFVGLALFEADDPFRLPWKTTKRGLNEEARVYQKARNQMNATARPILSFLDSMYTSEPAEDSIPRKVADNVQETDVRTLAMKPNTGFKAKAKAQRSKSPNVSVQFEAERSEIESVKRNIRQPNMSASQVGRYLLDDYLEKEGL